MRSPSIFKSMKSRVLHLLALCLLFRSGLSQTVVKNLPGLPGDLPFYLETGYIGVGELEDVQLFYYFVKSERSPKGDPLVLWFTGGLGCSGLSEMLYVIGPFTFNYENSTRDRPTLKLHEYSWTKVANIIFLDWPVGAGFSYANNWESYTMNDNVSADESYEFLRKWLKLHPEFLSNPLYIGGDSYSGIIVPIVTLEVVKGNETGLKPKMNLEGYLLGNPFTNDDGDINSRVAFAHLKGLISGELYEVIDFRRGYGITREKRFQSADINCNGDYVNVNESNAGCVGDLKVVTKDYNYFVMCLMISLGTIEKWVRCNRSLSYTYTVTEVIDIHNELIKRGYRALIYSGDHDMIVPYVGTLAWIETLNLTISRDWEAWFVDGQVAGYTTLYSYGVTLFTYATVKGAGHTAPEFKPKECFAMINRWFDYYYI